MSHNLITIFKVLGKILTLFSLYFLLNSFFKMDLERIYDYPRIKLCVNLLLLSLPGIITNYINAYIWKQYIDFFSQKKNQIYPIVKVYLKSNIAKYLPGNIMQYANRNILGNYLGIGHKIIAVASIMELVVIIFSALLFSVAISYQNVLKVMGYYIRYISDIQLLVLLFVIFMVFSLAVFLFYKLRLLYRIKQYLNLSFLILLFHSIILYVINFVISGWLLVGIFRLFLNQRLNFVIAASVNVVAWLAGYIIIGSPGGIGIKEAVFVFLLKDIFGAQDAAMVAVILRFCCILSDFISYTSTLKVRTLLSKGNMGRKV